MKIPVLNEFIAQFLNSLPASMHPVKSEFEEQLRHGITRVLEKCDLVTRQEFDVQTCVLEKTRARLKILQDKVARLEGLTALEPSREDQ